MHSMHSTLTGTRTETCSISMSEGSSAHKPPVHRQVQHCSGLSPLATPLSRDRCEQKEQHPSQFFTHSLQCWQSHTHDISKGVHGTVTHSTATEGRDNGCGAAVPPGQHAGLHLSAATLHLRLFSLWMRSVALEAQRSVFISVTVNFKGKKKVKLATFKLCSLFPSTNFGAWNTMQS